MKNSTPEPFFMKILNSYFFILVITISFLGCTADSTNNDPDDSDNVLAYSEQLNVPYGSEDKQTFDIYLPANRTIDTKVMLLVHGGGWTSGDKTDMNAIKDLIRQDLPNLAIVNLNYRLSDGNSIPFPMQIDDISAVINHLKTKQTEYVISNDFGFIGTSAGAHLSLLWSYKSDSGSDIKMACSIVGPTNFTDPAYLENEDPTLQALIDLYGEVLVTPFLEAFSPYHQATSSAPPTILFYGGQDPLVPTTQGTDMRDKLQELGVTHEFTLYPNAGHGWEGDDLIDTWQKLMLFTETYLMQ